MGRYEVGLLLVVLIAANYCYLTAAQQPIELLFRDADKHREATAQWRENPTVINPLARNAALAPLSVGVRPPPRSRSSAATQQFDERVSDYIASNVLRFAHNIGRQLLAEQRHTSKNEVFSPVSVMSALSLLMLGAKDTSYLELQRIFGLNVDAELRDNPSKFHEEFGLMLQDAQSSDVGALERKRKEVNWRSTEANNIRGGGKPATAEAQAQSAQIIRVANGMFVQIGYSANPSYSRTIKSVYGADVDDLDFRAYTSEARDHINSWVSKNTYGKIPYIINEDIPKSTNAMLASVLYFRGFWENSFFESATTLDNFYPDGAGNRAVKVKMMATGGVFPFYDSLEYNCRIIGLPYKGNTTTMYVIQPNQSSRAKLQQLQSLLDADKIEEIIAKMVRRSAVLAFPKMHFMRSFNMKTMLNHLGVNDIFSSDKSDLSLIGNTQAPASAQQVPLGILHRPPQAHHAQQGGVLDRREGLIFQRFGDIEDDTTSDTTQLNHTTTSSADVEDAEYTLPNQRRAKRQRATPLITRTTRKRMGLEQLEAQRNSPTQHSKSDLFVEDIVHKIDFEVNEHGTEAAAATLTYLRRSGTDVLFRADTPFMVLIRHDPTKLVLFYGIINEPEV